VVPSSLYITHHHNRQPTKSLRPITHAPPSTGPQGDASDWREEFFPLAINSAPGPSRNLCFAHVGLISLHYHPQLKRLVKA